MGLADEVKRHQLRAASLGGRARIGARVLGCLLQGQAQRLMRFARRFRRGRLNSQYQRHPDEHRTHQADSFRHGQFHRTVLHVQDPTNPGRDLAIGHRHDGRGGLIISTHARQAHEHLDISLGPAHTRDDQAIAAELALQAYPTREPPGHRVEEEQRLDETLQQVDEVVPALQVGEFVKQDHLELVDTPARDRGGRQEDQRADDSDEDRRGDPVADGDADTSGTFQGVRQCPTTARDLTGLDDSARSANPFDADKPGSEQEEVERRTGQPDPRESGRDSIESYSEGELIRIPRGIGRRGHAASQ